MVILQDKKPRRPMRGSRLSSFYPALPQNLSMSSIESAFQLQEYIALLVRQNPHDVATIVSVPGKPKSGWDDKSDEAGDKDLKNDFSVDEACWIYEQLRRLCQDLTYPLVTSLQQECTRSSCPEMKAGEWLYLCVAHGSDGAMEQCCAIDYILHTLDSATALLNSPRTFPSRLSIPQPSVRHFSSLARRLGRIFAHAYFHHREAFEQAEAENSLYARFLELTTRCNLVPPDFLVIPPRATQSWHGMSSTSLVEHEGDKADGERPRILAPKMQSTASQEAALKGSTSLRDRDSEPSDDNAPPTRESAPSPEKSVVHESPRRFGRSRTDTMIHSDAHTIGEELRNAHGSSTGLGLSDIQLEGELHGDDRLVERVVERQLPPPREITFVDLNAEAGFIPAQPSLHEESQPLPPEDVTPIPQAEEEEQLTEQLDDHDDHAEDTKEPATEGLVVVSASEDLCVPFPQTSSSSLESSEDSSLQPSDGQSEYRETGNESNIDGIPEDPFAAEPPEQHISEEGHDHDGEDKLPELIILNSDAPKCEPIVVPDEPEEPEEPEEPGEPEAESADVPALTEGSDERPEKVASDVPVDVKGDDDDAPDSEEQEQEEAVESHELENIDVASETSDIIEPVTPSDDAPPAVEDSGEVDIVDTKPEASKEQDPNISADQSIDEVEQAL